MKEIALIVFLLIVGSMLWREGKNWLEVRVNVVNGICEKFGIEHASALDFGTDRDEYPDSWSPGND